MYGTWVQISGSHKIGDVSTVPIFKIYEGSILSFRSDVSRNHNDFGFLKQKNDEPLIQRIVHGEAVAVVTTCKVTKSDPHSAYSHYFEVYGKDPLEVNELINALICQLVDIVDRDWSTISPAEPQLTSLPAKKTIKERYKSFFSRILQKAKTIKERCKSFFNRIFKKMK